MFNDNNIDNIEEYSLGDKFKISKFQKPNFSKLNKEQYDAVMFDNGPLLVIAGAGSGKTSVITNRLARLVYDGVAPESILLLTFTNKAANEMLTRAKSLLGGENDIAVNACTYHSFCTVQLRKYFSQAGLQQNFNILDAPDSVDTMNLLKEIHGYGKEKNFPKAKEIINILSTCANKDYLLDFYVYNCYPDYYDYIENIRFLESEYKKYKKEHNLVDYDDLLLIFLNLLREYPEIAKKISDTYEYIMVDEYQDSNRPQMQILKELRNKGNDNLMVVGDDFQSIYGFRGAEIQNILSFPKQWDNAKMIVLNQNYRSNQNILNFSNSVTEQASEKYTKELLGNRKDGIKPVVVNIDNQDIEARFVLSKLEDFQKIGIPLKNMAAIIRGSNDSIFLEKLLTQYGIPYQKFGGIKFLERTHIKDILAFLRVFTNYKDEISWFRIFQLYPDIGPSYARQISKEIVVKGFEELLDPKHQKRKYGRNLPLLYNSLKKMENMSLKEQLEFLIDYRHDLNETIINNSRRSATSKNDHLKQNDSDWKDSKLLIDMATGYSTATSFLTDITLESPDKGEKEQDYFNITTVHSAKGLEYDIVFILNCTDGVFPWDFPIKNENEFSKRIKFLELEEERRVFYVAITRAKTHLYLLVPHRVFKFGSSEVAKPSRYLTETEKTKKTYGFLNVSL